jgi:hypothetical protein
MTIIDATVGFVSLNDTNKVLDIYIAYFLSVLGFFSAFIYSHKIVLLDKKIELAMQFFPLKKINILINKHGLLFGAFASLTLALQLLSQSQSIIYFFLITIIFLFFYKKFGIEPYVYASLIFLTKNFFEGADVIGDAFHGAEHFVAFFHINQGLFNVFPNIGYLEEAPPVILSKFLNFIRSS